MAVLKTENVSLGYEGRVIAKIPDIRVNAGDYICIIGENGAGKSTLVRTILGLQEPLGGKITFGDGVKRNEIGYLPQQTDVQRDFPASVREIVISGCQARNGFRPFYGRDSKRLAAEKMEQTGVSELADRSYRDLSGGQQQRVLLARALCAARKLILLDEPVAGLDPNATEDMYDTIEALNKTGITVIMISHDMEATHKYASHIIHVKKNSEFSVNVNETDKPRSRMTLQA